MRLLGDFGLAEEIVQDTLVTALERWRRDGIPDRPGAWLTTAARRRAVDRLRRDSRYRDKLALLEAVPAPGDAEPFGPDDRLRLIFTCCHPALSREAQLALTLRAVCGFTTGQIAHAFVVSEAAVAQRLAGPAGRSSTPASRTGSQPRTNWTNAWPRCSRCCT